MDQGLKQIQEECGVFGIWNHKQAAELTYDGLQALQHRGQDGAGLVVSDQKRLKQQKGIGLVNDVFSRINFTTLKGQAAIGHVRRANGKPNNVEDVQPFVFRSEGNSIALALSGRIMNAKQLRLQLEAEGIILQTASDAEILAHLMKRHGKTLTKQSISKALKQLEGVYTFIILTNNHMYVALDPRGIRPLSIGKLNDAFVISSETCAFHTIGATYERDVLPGELLTLSAEGVESMQFSPIQSHNLCALEYIYFSRPDSNLNRWNVHSIRKQMGYELAKEAPADADIVTGIPDSSISAAMGYAEYARLSYEMAIIKNQYVGRTFMKRTPTARKRGVKIKLSPVHSIVLGKRIVVIDDSIVRGTTSQQIVQLLKEAGAKEVHMRIASPPIKYPCCYGIHMPKQKQLLAANYSIADMCRLIGADSLVFLSHEGLRRATTMKTGHNGICDQCFRSK